MKKLFLYLIIISLISCNKNQPPTCTIIFPSKNATYNIGDDISVSVDADDPEGALSEVRIYLDNIGQATLQSFPYSHEISSTTLTPGEHTLKATAKDSEGLEATDEISITVRSTVPVVSTISIASVTIGSAIVGGEVSLDGGHPVTARGICWNTLPNPSLDNKFATEGSGTGEFTIEIENLLCETEYYVRAYGTNAEGTAYGEQLTFTTSFCYVLPVVATADPDQVTDSTARGGGHISYNGGANIRARGICWSTLLNPTIDDNHTTDGVGGGSFTSFLSDLDCETTYYVRAYATNVAGTGYGGQASFNTTACAIQAPSVVTLEASVIHEDSVICGGNVTDDGGSSVTARGVCWSTNQDPTLSNSYTTDGGGIGTFNSYLTLLQCETTYYVRAYATNSIETVYGNQVQFTSAVCPPGLPSVVTGEATSVGETSALVSGDVTGDGGGFVNERGFYYSTFSDPVNSGTRQSEGSDTGTYSITLSGLLGGVTYYYAAYAVNVSGTSYGSTLSFTTTQPPGAPTVTTSAATSVGETSASIGGDVTGDGGSAVTDRGVYYSTSSDPVSSDTLLQVGLGTGSFSTSLSGLTEGMTYYYTAYAINSAGTSYGTTLSFTTTHTVATPSVSTVSATSETESSASVGGNVTSDGWGTVSERGVYYGTSADPATTGEIITIGNGPGTFETTLNGLSSGTKYYFVAFAINEIGTAFGDELVFITSMVPPQVTTSSVTNVSSASANSGGVIVDNGGVTVISKGVCWSTSPNPTIGDDQIEKGAGNGSFACTLTGLNASTTYYIRAFATNSVGTSYGPQASFTTSPVGGGGGVCPPGMVSYWRLEESAGPVYYDLYSDNDAIAPATAPALTTGASGKAQQFSSDLGTYLAIPDNASFDWSESSSFTIEFWVKYSGSTGNVMVFMARDDRPYSSMSWWIGAETNGTISFYMQGSNGGNWIIRTPSAYNNNQWHHVVAVRNGSIALNYLYVDGILQNPGGSSFSGFGTLNSSNPITVGNLLYQGTTEFHMTGAIDEVAIYDRALDLSTEIVSHYGNISQYQIGYCDGDNPAILSEPVINATVGMPYTYDVDASGNSLPTYELITAPSGMSINSSTGVITWTPVSQSVNSNVVVRAFNDKGETEQNFNIFLADSPVCKPNLLAYWDFDQAGSAGYVDNIQGFELAGTNLNTVPGISGNARSYNGVYDSLKLVDNWGGADIFFDFSDVPSFSFELWMKSNATPSQTMVLVGRDDSSNSSQYYLGVNQNGTVGFFLRDYPASPSSVYLEGGNVLDGNWHHIVATYNNSTGVVQLYVDNMLVDSDNQSFTDFRGTGPLTVGHFRTGANFYWYEGMLDELAFYSTVLNQTRINENYNDGISGEGLCTNNSAPVFLTVPNEAVAEGSTFYYKAEVTDIDTEDILNITPIVSPAWLNLSYTPGATSAIISGTPGNEDVGVHLVAIQVSDGQVNVQQQFQIEVLNINDPPIITSSPITSVNAGQQYTYSFTAVDIDDAQLTLTAPVKPAWLTFDPLTGILAGTPDLVDVGISNVILKVSDLQAEVEQVISINVYSPTKGNSAESILLNTETGQIETSLLVFPNPAKDELFFRLDGEGSSEEASSGIIEIWNNAGGLIQQVQVHSRLVRIDLSGLDPGVYLYRANMNSKYFSGSFIKSSKLILQ